MAPFAAALMDRFGIRQVTSFALLLVAAGSGLTIFVTQGWQLVLTWGLLIGVGTGSMAMVFAATIANRWFVARRGLVMGILTAAGATGQLIFLPVMANLTEYSSWRAASLAVIRRRARRRAVRASRAARLPGRPGRPRVRRARWTADDPPPPDPAGAARRAVARPARRRQNHDVLGAGRRLRHLRRHHQRADRHPLHAVGP